MGPLGRGWGRVSQLPTVQPPGSPLLCLSPGPTRDMQPTMKFVMDTSKYWFKPSITREQGKRKYSASGDKWLGSRAWVLKSGPWAMAEKVTAKSRCREGHVLWTSRPEDRALAAVEEITEEQGLPGNKRQLCNSCSMETLWGWWTVAIQVGW